MSRHGRSSANNKGQQVKDNNPKPQLPATTDNAKDELKPGEEEGVKKNLWTTIKDGYQRFSDGCKAFDSKHPTISKVLKVTAKVVAIGGAVAGGYYLAKGSDDESEVYDLDGDDYEELDMPDDPDDTEDTPLAEEAAEE